MASNRQPSQDELKHAISRFLEKHVGTESLYDANTKVYHLTLPGDEPITVGPGWACSNEKVKAELAQYIMDLREASPVPVPISLSKSDPVRSWQLTQARTYRPIGGSDVPTAFGTSEAANSRMLSTEIRHVERTSDHVKAIVRVIDPATSQYREDSVTYDRQTFFALKAWEIANSQSKYHPNLITGIEDAGDFVKLPKLNPDIMIKGTPAPLWLSLQVMRAWSFADRDAVTKAERRAQLKIMSREWRDNSVEVDLEMSEARSVEEAKKCNS